MPRVILPEPGERRVPIHLWGRVVPDGALHQLRRIASQPYVVEHVAAMPDLHVANAVAVGTVFATRDVVVPVALGGDLGCGMSAVRFTFPAAQLSPRDLATLLGRLTQLIPVGDAIHRGKSAGLPEALRKQPLSTGALEHTRERLGPRQLGTLGGGNHFIELDRDGGGDLWLLVHSGSRGLGSAIAAHHLRVAEAHGSGDLPGLPIGSREGQACLDDIGWALSFARANREALAKEAAALVTGLIGQTPDDETHVDIHHNFVALEDHFGQRLLVHRKGAIAAPRDELALIPGSMGTASYLVAGLGEASSFASASHGAGRVMTRREAREGIPAERFARSMRKVVFDERRRAALVEEAPEAYRNIQEVLEDEADLVRPTVRLEPIAVLKG